MDIPAKIQILSTIRRGMVYYFAEDGFLSDEPHYFVVLNRDVAAGQDLILVNAQSQITKRRAARSNMPADTLVEVPANSHAQLIKRSIFDCNSPLRIASQKLIEKLENGDLEMCGDALDSTVVAKLVKGVSISPLVERRDKDLL